MEQSKTSRKPKKVDITNMELLVAGGVAGAFGKTVTAPLDRVKILYQVTAESNQKSHYH